MWILLLCPQSKSWYQLVDARYAGFPWGSPGTDAVLPVGGFLANLQHRYLCLLATIAAFGCHCLLWSKATTLERSQRPYLRPSAAIVRCGRRPFNECEPVVTTQLSLFKWRLVGSPRPQHLTQPCSRPSGTHCAGLTLLLFITCFEMGL